LFVTVFFAVITALAVWELLSVLTVGLSEAFSHLDLFDWIPARCPACWHDQTACAVCNATGWTTQCRKSKWLWAQYDKTGVVKHDYRAPKEGKVD